MKRFFGTDGIRGKAGEFPLDAKTIRIIGRSIARQFKQRKGEGVRFVTGRDTRESGKWIEEAFHSGASSTGASSYSAGVITTPGVAFLTKEHNFDAGIVISASHNPYEDNGLKIFLATGEKLDSDTEKEIEKDIKEQHSLSDDRFSVSSSKAASFQSDYLNHLTSEFRSLSLSDVKMVVDCANGAASDLAPRLFESFGANVFAINNHPDGSNINEDSGSLHLEKLQQKVLEENADFGVAFDGDADRSLFADEKGGLVDGDATLWVMAQHLKNTGRLENRTVVATVMSNIGLELALNRIGVKLIRAKVGDKYVLEHLKKTGSSLGGEQSGHIIFSFFSLVGDGMQTALFVLEALMENDKTLSEMKTGFTKFPQILVNVKVAEKQPFEDMPEIRRATEVIEKELGESGRLLLRYSGTENLARVMIEGADQVEIEEQANRLAMVIEQKLG